MVLRPFNTNALQRKHWRLAAGETCTAHSHWDEEWCYHSIYPRRDLKPCIFYWVVSEISFKTHFHTVWSPSMQLDLHCLGCPYQWLSLDFRQLQPTTRRMKETGCIRGLLLCNSFNTPKFVKLPSWMPTSRRFFIFVPTVPHGQLWRAKPQEIQFRNGIDLLRHRSSLARQKSRDVF